MDIAKLKIDKFKSIHLGNFPHDIDPGIKSFDKNIEVIIYYIDKLEDVDKFVKLCKSTPLPQENRVIMIYQKGRKDGVNRDSIFIPFRENKEFKLRTPMMCSISDKLSACVMSRIV